MKKRVISTILVAAIMCMSTLSAFAVDKSEHEGRTNQMTVEETFTQKTVSANIDGKTFVSSHDKVNNVTTIQLISDGVILKEATIDHNELMAQGVLEDKNGSLVETESDESAGRYKIQGENTFTNFEYEQWKYPNYNNGKGYFWFLRHPSDTQHSVYEINNSSEYHDDLMAFKDAVETINTTEISVGFSVALGVGSVVTIGLKGAALLMALDAYLDSNDVPTGVSNVMEWEEAVEEAQACWLRLFY